MRVPIFSAAFMAGSCPGPLCLRGWCSPGRGISPRRSASSPAPRPPVAWFMRGPRSCKSTYSGQVRHRLEGAVNRLRRDSRWSSRCSAARQPRGRSRRAQQGAMPVVGLLHPTSLEAFPDNLRGFRQGLKETGYVEGENVAFEYRWAHGQVDRLPELAADLVRRRVAVIATASPPAAFVAKEASATIPIVFGMAQDPVRLGLVASLARPGGNLTGINFLLTEMVPAARRLAVLVNPTQALNTEGTLQEVQAGAQAMGLQIRSTLAPAARSMLHSQALNVSVPMLCLWAAAPCSPAVACNWRNGRRITACQRAMRGVSTSRPAG